MKKIYSFLFFLVTFLCFSQEKPSLQLVREIRKDAICLRWAVDSPVAWQKSNTIGFQLERYTILRNGTLLSPAERLDLGTFVVPSLNAWKTLVEQNDNAAIVAQAIYGEDFQVEMASGQNAIEGIVNKAKEIEQRFSFALMAADLDFDVAQFAGWGYVDKQVKNNEKYLYKIRLLPSEKLSLDEATVIGSLGEYEQLPAPIDFTAFFQDQKVLLTWDYKILSNLYSYYFLEKSEEKAPFKPISELPVVNMNQNANSPAMIYIDSLSENNKEFSYRLRGKTIFGSYSPYSETLTGKGLKALSAAAQLSQIQPTTKKQYRILWNFPKENEHEITHFALLHASDDKNYQIITDNIPVSQREILHLPFSSSNYYKIRTFGKDGSKQDSFAMLIQPEDETPPAIVQELSGTIDSLGVVQLH
ncbi:hypothetical protein [Capnocytophaga catalasegens]|uniref:Uncharacterized protein n=1 Tax=Capnocytophaga catalasegens TaxID=1004260 RepID=A0AAV5AYH3_9FLAO|nr:hypothetical protein [Capnocytophaga catalasegens]GIZ15731.1 hypothetical protein RCZ03_17310 [Capnocytophaga catalasegens]GJM50118.1 hypothetical protein RCZ15_10920 [Capnocytophaga catalasegens]GJM53057.1 hypothetical protein RCZ16_13740 [Capnocytophaga catalasegens]